EPRELPTPPATDNILPFNACLNASRMMQPSNALLLVPVYNNQNLSSPCLRTDAQVVQEKFLNAFPVF
ncbi:MAG: hypothetical protein ACE1Z4_05865, partial [Gammaproteobacteria bacterium]